ncbi:DUF2255 family protein [Actinoplanes friuliensis]|uniref:DUF2255 family protein n=1 Tax=Actinoplanes friuliensis DSM 7358 TaxID=1246995 RepID=U5VZ54_9ACTN|nr:DUF2255 family protein [Actinoplanes friuliensis]AGZ41010.1 hypothetical protein AFR_13620 [Actinoplanes friuliensis DSM 7358]
MTDWIGQQAAQIAAPQEVQVATRRSDGSLRRATTIWIVRDGDRVFIRSTNGRTADWFRGATATGTGQIISGGRATDVVFTEAAEANLPAVDSAYRRKYSQYASIVDHLVQEGPRSATLQLQPA